MLKMGMKSFSCLVLFVGLVHGARIKSDNVQALHKPSDEQRAAAHYNAATGKYWVTHGPDSSEDGVAWAVYVPQEKTLSNFGRLRLSTSGNWPDEIQMHAMGYIEGYLTALPIYQHWSNMQWYLKQNTNKTTEVRAWLDSQLAWYEMQVKEQVANGASPFWEAQALIHHQVKGIVEGYNLRVAELQASNKNKKNSAKIEQLTLSDIMLLNTFGDMDDLLVMADHDLLDDKVAKAMAADSTSTIRTSATTAGVQQQPSTGPFKLRYADKFSKMTPGQVRGTIARSGHCSALIKVTSDLSDILLGHTTWWSYTSLVRLYKQYITALHNPVIKAQRSSFSSYPGLVSSMDDFMISDSGIVMMETSNDVYDISLYSESTNQACLSWQRARAASMLANDGATYAKYIQAHNSGTYNNQYMIVDLKRFRPLEQLQAGLLTVIEMLPGGAYVADTTQELERGYWPSYNVPYFVEVYNKTGYPGVQDLLNARGPEFREVATGLSYQVAPRAKIFRRDAGGVDNLTDLKRVLRSNGWRPNTRLSDPFSPSPYDAICARGDLDPDSPDPSGCYDAKVTNYAMALQMSSEAINGPAWDGDGSDNGHPAFAWNNWQDYAHAGMIPVFRTQFERFDM